MLRRHAATSASLRSMAYLSAVLPSLQGRLSKDSEWKMVKVGRAEAPGPRSDVSFRLDQKTANFKVAIVSREMQWSVLTEEKQRNQLAQTEFCLIKTIIVIGGGNYPSVFASISALHCSKRRQTSRWP
jgi:hypothetical protein